jgi:hypothetical protein
MNELKGYPMRIQVGKGYTIHAARSLSDDPPTFETRCGLKRLGEDVLVRDGWGDASPTCYRCKPPRGY